MDIHYSAIYLQKHATQKCRKLEIRKPKVNQNEIVD